MSGVTTAPTAVQRWMVMGMADVLLAVCYIALCVLVISMCVSIVAILAGLIATAYKCWREENERKDD